MYQPIAMKENTWIAEGEDRRVRPLPVISDFVAELLPARLSVIREGHEGFGVLLLNVQRMLRAISFTRLAHNAQDWPIALLDLKILEIGLSHTARLCGDKIAIPADLIKLIDILSCGTGRPTILTYEEIVLVNPEWDPRTFTISEPDPVTEELHLDKMRNENTWSRILQSFSSTPFPNEDVPTRVNSEEFFYAAHRTIEAHMSRVLLCVRAAVVALATEQRAQMTNAVHFLQEACNEMAWIGSFAKSSFQHLRNEDFLLFREYLREHPFRNGPGASGAGSPSFSELDLWISGTNLPEEDLCELRDHRSYYLPNSQATLANAIEMTWRGYSLMALSSHLGHPKAVDDAIDKLSQALRIWRSTHYRIVADHLPEVIKGKDQGTRGKPETHTYLQRKIHLHAYSLIPNQKGDRH